MKFREFFSAEIELNETPKVRNLIKSLEADKLTPAQFYVSILEELELAYFQGLDYLLSEFKALQKLNKEVVLLDINTKEIVDFYAETKDALQPLGYEIDDMENGDSSLEDIKKLVKQLDSDDIFSFERNFRKFANQGFKIR